jgi:hypothetical protein
MRVKIILRKRPGVNQSGDRISPGPFLLVGTDAEGERRESTHASIEQAVAIGRECSKNNSSGPAWQRWEVWGNHPQTGEWVPLACSIIAKFKLGRIVATPNALSRLTNEDILKAIGRHQAGDWGALDADDWNANERALKNGGRLFSRYFTSQNIKLWVITEADRSATTVLLPEDY